MTIRWVGIQSNISVYNLREEKKNIHILFSSPVIFNKLRFTHLTRSGYLSLRRRIVLGTRPLSLYASSPVGFYQKWKQRQKEFQCTAQQHMYANRRQVWNLQSLGNFREQHYTVNTNSSSLCNLFAYKMEKLMFLTWFALKGNKSNHRGQTSCKRPCLQPSL